MRAYTLQEIDKMRRSVEELWLFGPAAKRPPILWRSGARSAGGGWGRSYKEADKQKAVEEQLRTYMAAGTDPDELHCHAFDGQREIYEDHCTPEERAAYFPPIGISLGGTMNQFFTEDEKGKMVEDFPPPSVAAKMGYSNEEQAANRKRIAEQEKVKEPKSEGHLWRLLKWVGLVVGDQTQVPPQP